jgi:hypothetical protein
MSEGPSRTTVVVILCAIFFIILLFACIVGEGCLFGTCISN